MESTSPEISLEMLECIYDHLNNGRAYLVMKYYNSKIILSTEGRKSYFRFLLFVCVIFDTAMHCCIILLVTSAMTNCRPGK